jgi:predicted MPP superfamily phosphohydrolase
MNPLFWLTALGLYLGLHLYILRKGWRALAGTGAWRVFGLVVSILLALSFIGGRVLLARLPGVPATILVVIGNVYLAAWVYFILFALLIDILRAANALVPFFPRAVREQPRRASRAALVSVLAATVLILAAGAVHAARFRVRDLEISIPKAARPVRELSVVLASDLHVNPIMRDSHLEDIVATINGLEPDLIILAGDVINDDITPRGLERMAVTLRKLKAKYGVLGVLGNHEIYGGVERSLDWLARSGVDVLVDRTVLIADSFWIAGRMDYGHGFRGGGRPRKPLGEVLSGVDKGYPLILLDHQPRRLEDARANGVDFQISGHTHGGQIFPINLINRLIYEDPQGYYRKGATQYYVSSGVGNWGPPVRIGSTAEIVRIKISLRP